MLGGILISKGSGVGQLYRMVGDMGTTSDLHSRERRKRLVLRTKLEGVGRAGDDVGVDGA